MAGSSSSGPIPKGWLGCPRISEDLTDGTFLSFKTPLVGFDNRLCKEDRWDAEHVFEHVKSFQKSIGLWIDLTNTARYYPPSTVRSHGTDYYKLTISGHGTVPSTNEISTFIKVVSSHLKRHPTHLIGVHCTHGFNRTGYLIVSYLVNVKQYSVVDAISEFRRSRPAGIYRQNYIDTLCRTLGEGGVVVPLVIEPAWAGPNKGNYQSPSVKGRAENLGAERTKQSKSEQSWRQAKQPEVERNIEKRSKRTRSKNRGKQSEDRKRKLDTGFESIFPQIGIFPVRDARLRSLVLNDLNRMINVNGSSSFLGRVSTSLTGSNIGLLSVSSYLTTWICPSRVRYFLLIKCDGQVFLIDTANSVFQVTGTFPDRMNLSHGHLYDTVIDGHMVTLNPGEKERTGNTPHHYYMAQDIITINGSYIGDTSLQNRIGCITTEVIDPRIRAINSRLISPTRESRFRLQLQPMLPLVEAGKALDCSRLLQPPIGLAFIPVYEDYTSGPSPSTLEWRRPKPTNASSSTSALSTVISEEFLLDTLGKIDDETLGGGPTFFIG